MRPSPSIFALSILTSLAFSGPAASDRDAAPAPAAVTSAELPVVSWDEIARHPGNWLGRRVRLRFQFHSRVADWNPYLTRFGSGQFVAVQGWADEQFPWIETDYERPAVRVFARTDGQAARDLARAEPFGRFDVVGVVREALLDLPWIEIDSAWMLPEQISEATVIHAARAIKLMKQQAWGLADLELSTAVAAPLPDAALLEIGRLRQATRDHDSSAVDR